VRSLYEDFLGRASDIDGYYYWFGSLKGGALSRTDVARGMAQTPEWIGHIVDDFYEKTLDRPPEPDGRAFWIGQIQGGRPAAEVAASFYSSNEYFNDPVHGSGSLSTWVTDLYGQLLGRAPESDAARDSWVDQAKARGRGWVALSFYQSQESREERVNELYHSLLERSADPSGMTYWANRILGEGDLALASFLASSPEYFGYALEYENP
jgi:hypothetical protein